MLDVRRLRLLRDLAHLGTIAAVAKAHTYTPSAVSQQLTTLEREAGVPLVARTGRRVALTAAGLVLAKHAEEVLSALERAAAAVTATRCGLTGALRIGAFPTAVRTLLPPALVTLGRDHPYLDLSLIELDPVAVPDALRERRIDLALGHDYDVAPVEPDRSVEVLALLEETVYLAVPAADSGAASADAVHTARHEGWIVGSPGTLCHTVALQACRAAGFTPRIRHHADDFVTVLALVAAGQGVALVPELGLTHPPEAVRLVPLPIRRRTHLAYRKGGGAHPAVLAGIGAVRAAADAYRT